MDITTLFWDVDNTLLDFTEGSRLCMQEGFRHFGLSYRDEMFPVFRRMNDDLWHQVEQGSLTRDRLFEIRWNTIFRALGIDFDGPLFESYFRSSLRESAVPIDGAKEMLHRTHRICTNVITSNAVRAQQENRLKKAGLLSDIDIIATSEDAGCSKPQKEFFDYCMTVLPQGTRKENILIIGDNPAADIAGGKAFGIHTCLFDRDGSQTCPDADFVIRSLWELKELLPLT